VQVWGGGRGAETEEEEVDEERMGEEEVLDRMTQAFIRRVKGKGRPV